jgi:hypothetical protein
MKPTYGRGRRRVMLTDFVSVMCAGRAGDELIFGSEQGRPMAEACKRVEDHPVGRIPSTASYFGKPPDGHSDTRMVEKHYGHLAPSYIVAEATGRARRGSASSPTRSWPR